MEEEEQRTRKQIEDKNEKTRAYGSGIYENSELILEVLLDIRDLVQKIRNKGM